jgi:tetratricopeptide (TPR) repeat protein
MTEHTAPTSIADDGRARPRRTQFRRIVVVAVGLLVCLAAWYTAPTVMKWQVRRTLASRDLASGETLLKRFEAWFGPDGESEFLWARLDRKRGNWTGVRDHLLRARDLKHPVNVLEREQWLTLAQSGQIRDAEPHLPRLLTDPRNDGAEICEAFVNGYFINRRMVDAARLLDAWIADFPKDAEPLLIRGKIRAEQQFLKEAESDLRAAHTLDPNSRDIALELADVLVLERKIESALEIYRTLATADPSKVRARLGVVKCLRLLNRLDEALAAAKEILDRDASDREALVERGLAELELSRYQDATETLLRALKINPRSLVVRQALARAYRATGELSRAQEHAEYVAEAQAALAKADQLAERAADRPNDADLRYEIGMIYLKYAVPERGVQWLKSALNCDPNHQAARRALDDHLTGRRLGANATDAVTGADSSSASEPRQD